MRRRETTRHMLVAAFLAALVMLLLIEGFTTKTVGAESQVRAGAASPLAGQPPVLRSLGGKLVAGQQPPGRMVALTFDDGPDPRYTPKVAAILRRYHAPATFFEVGSMVVRHPELTRMLHHDGFEIGNHTFTHANLVAVPGWQRKEQVAAAESAFAGVIGERPRLLRPPYSSTPDAVTPVEERAYEAIARHGYDIVLSNYDTEDWSQPGVSTIVRNAIPHGHRGGIVLMHDAGGRRTQTLQALPHVIQGLRAHGFRLVSLATMMGVRPAAIYTPASSAQDLRGSLFVDVLRVVGWLVAALTLLVEAVTVLVGIRMAIGLGLALVQRRRARGLTFDPSYAPPVSVLVPAYNEAVGVERCVRSLAAADYPGELEIIVVDDGSQDATADIVDDLALDRVRLLRQANAGKAAALNRGLAAARHDIIVTVDADTIFEPRTLALLVQRFADPRVGSVAGNTKIGNRGRLVGRWQHIEYVMGFNLDRRAYEVIGATPTVPGAIGAFRRAALADAGGISGATLAEDTDVTLEVVRAGWRVVYEERARAWTEAPSGIRGLYRQRRRWAYGTIQSAWKHRSALWGRGDRALGRRAVGILMVFQILLPLAAPLIDLFAIYGIFFLDPMPILAFWVAFNLFQLTLAWVAFGLDGESRRPLWALPLQQIVWRQVMYFVVLDGIISALLGQQHGWRHLERSGDAVACSNASSPSAT